MRINEHPLHFVVNTNDMTRFKCNHIHHMLKDLHDHGTHINHLSVAHVPLEEQIARIIARLLGIIFALICNLCQFIQFRWRAFRCGAVIQTGGKQAAKSRKGENINIDRHFKDSRY